MTDLPKSYFNNTDVLFNVDNLCTACPFGSSQGRVVHSVYPDNIQDTKLIVVLDYPNDLDLLNHAVFPDEEKRKEKRNRYNVILEKRRNGASILRYFITKFLKLDHQKQVVYLYALKCPPNEKTVTEKYLRICSKKWLEKEFSELDKYIPTVPVLIAGSYAFKALKNLEPAFKPYNLNSLRGEEGHFLKQHPLVFSFSPSSCANAQSRIEKDVQLSREGLSKVISFDNLPLLFGSPLWIFQKNFSLLTKLI